MTNPENRVPPTAIDELKMRIRTIRREREMHVENLEMARSNVEHSERAIRNADSLIRQYEDVIGTFLAERAAS